MVEATEDIDEHGSGKGRREKRPFSKYCPFPPPPTCTVAYTRQATLYKVPEKLGQV